MKHVTTYAIGPTIGHDMVNRRAVLLQMVSLVLLLVVLVLPHHGFAMCPDHTATAALGVWSLPASSAMAPEDHASGSRIHVPVWAAPEPGYCVFCQAPFVAALLYVGVVCFILITARAGDHANRSLQQPLILLATPPPRFP